MVVIKTSQRAPSSYVISEMDKAVFKARRHVWWKQPARFLQQSFARLWPTDNKTRGKQEGRCPVRRVASRDDALLGPENKLRFQPLLYQPASTPHAHRLSGQGAVPPHTARCLTLDILFRVSRSEFRAVVSLRRAEMQNVD